MTSRRNFLKAASIASLSGITNASLTSTTGQAPMIATQIGKKAPIPTAKGIRVVIVGAGFSGLSISKYLKQHAPNMDVILIDRNSVFTSCPMSNVWLADQINLDFLAHSYYEAAKNNKYIFFQATLIDVDRPSKTVFTDQGTIQYDYLVLAPGIDYDYSKIGVDDPADEYRLRTHYPAGFTGASELLSLKRKLHQFKGGTFLMTVPKGNYRCMAAPYERACMAAAIFLKRGIKAKVLLLDMNNDIRIKKEGFQRAFNEVYSNIIQYEPNVAITNIDINKQIVESEFDSYEFDDAIIYPPIRASKIIESLGWNNPESLQKEANIDIFKYHLKGDMHVYIAGDARSQPFSKSGNTAYSEGQYIAEVIIAHSKDLTIEWRSPQTMCFSAVTINPLESMSIIAFYNFNKTELSFVFDRVHMINKWNIKAAQAGLAWAEGVYRDLFYD